MRRMTKIALGTCAILAAVATTVPAQAHVSIGIGLGYPGYPYYPGYYYPGYYYGPPARAVCDPYSRWYDPYRCRYYYADYDYDFYYGPVFIDGIWVSGPLRWREFGGRREFFWHGGWHSGSGFRSSGFRHGGMRRH